jgi:enolase-phosphatase E1
VIRLLDIEGTICPVAFVHQVMFPFARERLPAYLRASADEPRVRTQLDQVAEEAALDHEDLPAILETLLAWMDADRKHTALKALQGQVWRTGFESGALVAPLYDEVRPTLERWVARGEVIAVYSSGSVEAQRLLFAHTDRGDLSGLVSAWFDTTTGPKRAPASYAAIAASLGRAPAHLAFYSDLLAEVSAARMAGLEGRWVVREGPVPDGASDHLQD